MRVHPSASTRKQLQATGSGGRWHPGRAGWPRGIPTRAASGAELVARTSERTQRTTPNDE
eukprot:1269323-Prymnesium_polylepis.2